MSSETQRPGSERRAEPRRAANGAVTLRPEGLQPSSLSGQLLDVSNHGFRAEHALQALVAGTIVGFTYGGAEGRARVVWTRIMGSHVESGFLVLPSSAS